MPTKETASSSKKRVFITYAREDEDLAKLIHGWLKPAGKKHGFEIWIDQEGIGPGDNWDEKIRQSLKESHLAVLVASVNYFGKDYVLEVELPFIERRWRDPDFRVLAVRVAGLSDQHIPTGLEKLQFVAQKEEVRGPFPKFGTSTPPKEKVEKVLMELVEAVSAAVQELREQSMGSSTSPKNNPEPGGGSEEEEIAKDEPALDLEAMKAIYEKGASLKDLASVCRVPAKQVEKLLSQHGVQIRSGADTKAIKKKEERQSADIPKDLRGEVLRSVKARQPVEEICSAHDVTRGQFWSIIWAAVKCNDLEPSELRLLLEGGSREKYSEEELVQMLREASRTVQGNLTANYFTAYGRGRSLPDGRPWPTHQTPMKRFGSWHGALELAGLPANRKAGPARKFSEDDCIQAVAEVGRKLGSAPTTEQYEQYARASGGRLPSLATVRNRCDHWTRALKKAGLVTSENTPTKPLRGG